MLKIWETVSKATIRDSIVTEVLYNIFHAHNFIVLFEGLAVSVSPIKPAEPKIYD